MVHNYSTIQSQFIEQQLCNSLLSNQADESEMRCCILEWFDDTAMYRVELRCTGLVPLLLSMPTLAGGNACVLGANRSSFPLIESLVKNPIHLSFSMPNSVSWLPWNTWWCPLYKDPNPVMIQEVFKKSSQETRCTMCNFQRDLGCGVIYKLS